MKWIALIISISFLLAGCQGSPGNTYGRRSAEPFGTIRTEPAPTAAPTTPGPVVSQDTAPVRVTLDRPGAAPGYRIGETLHLFVEILDDGFLFLYNVAADGKLHQIFPNDFDAENEFNRGASVILPRAGYDFRVDGPPGKDEIVAVLIQRTAPDTAPEATADAVTTEGLRHLPSLSERAFGNLLLGTIDVEGATKPPGATQAARVRFQVLP